MSLYIFIWGDSFCHIKRLCTDMVLNFDMSPFLLLPVDFSPLDLKLNVHVTVMLNSSIPAVGRKMF